VRWKVNYHAIYPWLLSPYNTTTLESEAQLSPSPEF
jgi:hypothetical protein